MSLIISNGIRSKCRLKTNITSYQDTERWEWSRYLLSERWFENDKKQIMTTIQRETVKLQRYSVQLLIKIKKQESRTDPWGLLLTRWNDLVVFYNDWYVALYIWQRPLNFMVQTLNLKICNKKNHLGCQGFPKSNKECNRKSNSVLKT